ncbi:MAG: hypothetical protein FRX49_06045 [Trebouxia sp. A1-2]|nr:MAG: hypothetical protein FRX49_06045 [Trebouxia sp. A1-2]
MAVSTSCHPPKAEGGLSSPTEQRLPQLLRLSELMLTAEVVRMKLSSLILRRMWCSPVLGLPVCLSIKLSDSAGLKLLLLNRSVNVRQLHAAEGGRHAAVADAAANGGFAHVHLGCLEADRSAGDDALEVDCSCLLQSPCSHFC